MGNLIVPFIAALIMIGLSYPLLNYLGVKENLFKRSAIFGVCLWAIQTIPVVVIGQASIILGAGISLVLSYIYVNKVLNLPVIKNIAIIFLLPFIPYLVLAILMMLFLKNS